MRRMLVRELSWFGSNLAIMLAYIFVFGLGQAIVLLWTSPDGSMAGGWCGNPVSQVLGWATMAGWIGAFSSPLLAAGLVAYRLGVRLVGRPRAVAYATALGITAVVGVLAPREAAGAVGVLGVALLGYGALMRVPGETLAGLPSAVRGFVVGLALSCVWLVGSVAAVGWAIHRARRGEWAEAGAVAVAGTAVPATLILTDLFRDHVPGENYLVAVLLLGSLACGVAALVGPPAVALLARQFDARPLQ